MTKRLIFNGFSMNVVSHIYHGLWRHPESRQVEFNSLDYWVDLVRIFERGRFAELVFPLLPLASAAPPATEAVGETIANVYRSRPIQARAAS